MSHGRRCTSPRSRPMVGSALARMVESSEPMNTGSRIPHTIRCASWWVSGEGAAATGASIDSSLHFDGRRATLVKDGGRAYLPDAWGRASDSSPSDDAAGAGFGLTRMPTIRPRPVTQSNGFLADFCFPPATAGERGRQGRVDQWIERK